ncbi:MAG: hypothetical protein PVJ21_18905 [Anaerolineales bacterium]|jgi:hypothetical protein
MSKRIAVGSQPIIKIDSVEGDLRLVGWDNDEFLIRSDDETITLQQNEDEVNITCQDDLALNVPKNSRVHILTVNGDTSVRGLLGDFEANLLNGDVAIRDVGKVTLGAVESDFSLRGAQGDVHVKSVGGDASLREVNGSLTLDSVSDDLAIRGVGGNLKVDVDADVVIHLAPKPGQEYSVVAGDDIMLVIPEKADATLTLSSEVINVHLPNVQQEDTTSRVVTLGDGSAQVKLDAGGDVLVTNRQDAAESADEFGNFAGMMFDWGSWGRELGQDWGNIGREIGERVSRQAQRAAQRAERKVRKAAGRRNARMKYTWDFDNMPKAPKREPVSEEERMTILRMLAEKKITSEEAEQLLSALEGGK